MSEVPSDVPEPPANGPLGRLRLRLARTIVKHGPDPDAPTTKRIASLIDAVIQSFGR